MNNKIMFSLLVFSLLLISACAQTTVAPTKIQQKPAEINIVSETNKIRSIEDGEEVEEPKEEVIEEKQISPEVKEFLGIADNKVESLKYSYKGPETENFFYEFSVKGDRIKYILSPTYFIDGEDDEYDTIYLDKEAKTALAYCDDRTCRVKGKKADLDYDARYMQTPLDWLNKIEFAEKLGEELIEKRSTWKLAADNFTIWIDTFFGVPMRVESGDNLYKFTKMSFNQVKDEDVIPKD